MGATSSFEQRQEKKQQGKEPTPKGKNHAKMTRGWRLLFRDSLQDLRRQSTWKPISLKVFLGNVEQGLAIDLLLPEDGLLLMIELHTLDTQVINELLRL